ncbi:MAG: MFS transporter [Verrucomicrobia bacterium]|nr:MFS transporter [Verrucomicrobiota bacterium]
MTANINAGSGPWYQGLTRYHWFVLIVAALGWLFDCLDQQLFTLARVPAITELLTINGEPPPTREAVALYSGYATSIFLIGWATGGLIFGVLGDKIGRAKTMMWTILIYSVCTGLSAASVGFWDFAFYRFITGLGVGGEFAVGVALVAEVMPDRARPYAISLLQALSAVGNISAALINIGLGQIEDTGISQWRIMFIIGAFPALLALVIRSRLKEPERWKSISAKGSAAKELGSYGALFGHPVWRYRAFVGLALAFAGVVGLWGIGFFSPDLIRSTFTAHFKAQGMSDAEVSKALFLWTGITMIVQNVAGFVGIGCFGLAAQRIGRRPTFAVAFVGAMVSTALVFWNLREFSQIFWMVPLMGFFQFSLFGGYAVYFPELFPTSLRSTGVSFCYNVGRFVAASGPLALGLLTSKVFAGHPEAFRYAGVTMCAVFLVGLIALPFAPETKGQPLPEEERGLVH